MIVLNRKEKLVAIKQLKELNELNKKASENYCKQFNEYCWNKYQNWKNKHE